MKKVLYNIIHGLKILNAFLMPLIAIGLVIYLYSFTYSTINFIDSGIFNLYATHGKYDYNPFLSQEIDEKTKIYSTLLSNFEITKVNRIQDLYEKILEDKEFSRNILEGNKEYTNYLKGMGLDINELFYYGERIMKLDESILNGAYYFMALSVIIIYALFYKFRLGIYISGAVIYLLSNLSNFTNQLSSYFIVTIMNKIDNNIEISSLDNLRDSFFPAIKEAILTYIILDVIFESINSKKQVDLNHEMKKFYYSIYNIVDYYDHNKHNFDNVKFVKLHISINKIKKFLVKNRSDDYCRKILECVETVVNIKKDERNLIIVDNELFIDKLREIIDYINRSSELTRMVY
ncbi:hypothetical protein KQI88_10330 [Alkaliphilus sp. MSJ-5]|uniref:Uncharacterized protein n=1 Tax=Alkaliphilus flagellatus TaxID=2841507 RepID=A0ABS6G5W9_9FIRM|nr:hypothetical protein [Alkaliphilus flagellatus]MBU5676815.1 hypothetical protein [Alkaliphilus flagellatus]